VPGAEIVAGPDIDSTRDGVFDGKGAHGHGKWGDKENGAEEEEKDGTGAGVGGGGDPAGADDAGDGEERDVTQAEFAMQAGRGCRQAYKNSSGNGLG
jgi:hypothetical protein